jgi:hypothetical protein
MEERQIMSSDDKSLELTTTRILKHSKDRTVEIKLEEFEGYEFVSRHIGNYKTILIVISILTILTVLLNLQSYNSGLIRQISGMNFWEYLWSGTMLKIWIFFLVLSFIFFTISRRYFVRIDGKFNSFEFQIASPRSSSVNKFLAEIEVQSNKAKNANPS